MATQEEKTESPPALIDYDSTPSEQGLTFKGKDLIEFFTDQLVKKHRTSTVIDSIRDKTLAKKLVEAYPEEKLKLMVINWMGPSATQMSYDFRLNIVHRFEAFYKARHRMEANIRPRTPEDFGWE